MSFPCEVDGIVYELFTDAETDCLVHVVSHAFTEFEPMTSALGVPYEDFCLFMRKLAAKAVKEKLSIIARNPADGEVIGALVCEDLMGEPPEGMEDVTPMLAPVFTLLDGLTDPYRESRQYKHGQCLHIFMMAVLRNSTGKDIAQEMVRQSMINAKEMGYCRASTEATGVISQYIFKEKYGFDKLEETLYKDFLFDGEPVFRKIERHPSAALMDRPLEG